MAADTSVDAKVPVYLALTKEQLYMDLFSDCIFIYVFGTFKYNSAHFSVITDSSSEHLFYNLLKATGVKTHFLKWMYCSS